MEKKGEGGHEEDEMRRGEEEMRRKRNLGRGKHNVDQGRKLRDGTEDGDVDLVQPRADEEMRREGGAAIAGEDVLELAGQLEAHSGERGAQGGISLPEGCVSKGTKSRCS